MPMRGGSLVSEDLGEQIAAIYEAYYDDIYFFLLYFTGRQEDAEDLTQEVFSRLLHALPEYDGRVKMKTWLFSIAKYAAIDQYRKQKWLSLLTDNWLTRMKTKEGLPESSLETKEERQMVKEALLRLKPHLRMIIILRYIEDYSVKETAEMLAIPEGKVRVDCHRGLKALQKILGESMKGGMADVFAR